MQEIIDGLKALNIGEVKEDELLRNHTTYKVGGKAIVVYPKNLESLKNLVDYLVKNKVKYFPLGKGSNVLFSDFDYNGVIIKMDNFNKAEYNGEYVTAGAGLSLIRFSRHTVRRGLKGLEFADGIPGTVGGAVFMNAGCYGEDVSMILESCTVLTKSGEVQTLSNEEMNFSYRTSILQKRLGDIVVEAKFKLTKCDANIIQDMVIERRKKRILSQPLDYPSAGSVFRNPEGTYAGKIIEDLGLKGYQVGNAQVSEKHANFIINKGNCSASDIKEIIDYIKVRVKEEYNIKLRVEQRLVNWNSK